MLPRPFRDLRGWCLGVALAAALLALAGPRGMLKQALFTHIFVIDITRSMNVTDYQDGDSAVSRLEYVKGALDRALRDLPCGSRAALGIFTERRATLLFEPLEVCSAFHEIEQSLAHLDWRMAWAADSRIAQGLASAIELTRARRANLVLFTDGHEAPPVNPRYRTSFEEVRGNVKGLIVGVGGLTPAPIPKFDAQGRQIGFYGPEEVPHRSTFGLSHCKPSEIEGYNPRNAPFGSEWMVGGEHLSALHEPYLHRLAAESGLLYHRLQGESALSAALRSPVLAENRAVETDISWIPAAGALLALVLSYLAVLAGPRRNSSPHS